MDPLVTAGEVATRMGATFTDAQVEQAESIIASATDLILEAVDKDDAWLDEQLQADTVPKRLRVTCKELAVRGMANPRGVRSSSRTLGAASSSESFADAAAGVELTEREERQCRRAVYGTLSGSAHARTLADHLVRDDVGGGVEVLELEEAHGS